MAADKFNSLTGYSAGLPPIDIVAANGNIVTNHNYPAGNVTSNKIYANNYYYANGAAFSSDPAGANTEIQFNNNGVFGASANLVFDTATSRIITRNATVLGETLLGDAQTVSIQGGVNGYVLQTDGAGGLSWTAQTGGGGGGNGTPGGSNMQVQFNSAGAFAGDAGFIYDTDTNLLTATSLAGEGGNISNVTYANITGIGNISAVNLTGADNTVLYANGVFADISAGASANFANFAGNLTVASQPNITSVGTLTGLQVGGGLSVVGNIGGANIAITDTATFTGPVVIDSLGNLTVQGNANLQTSPNIELPVANLHIDGGLNGYVLATDGAGGLSWTLNSGGGGGGSPGGANTQMQFNDGGLFGGDANVVYNKSTNTMTMAGTLVANNMTVGSGAYSFRTTKVATGVSTTTSAVEICATEASTVSAVDYTIVATDAANSSRQTVKITSAVYGTTVNYSEYATISVGSLLADFAVTYVPGDAFRNAQVVLYATPATTNSTTYKILLEEYSS
tara:strand:+ start:3112 stop:4638 length:1527 start_codon:yes stop_codon:yes gene_type:complete